MKRNRLISFIVVLCYIGAFKICVLCTKTDNLRSCDLTKHPDEYNREESIYKIRNAREIKETAVHDNKKELSKQTRGSRGVRGSSRHLQVGDAHRIANYFLTGGPLKGHAHFIRERNCDSDNSNDNVVGDSNPITESTTNSPVDRNNSNTNSPVDRNNSNTNSDSIVGAALPPVSHATDELHSNPFESILGSPQALYHAATEQLHSLFHPVLDSITRLQHSPLQEALSQPLKAALPHINTLQELRKSFVKAAISPLTNSRQAATDLEKVLKLSKPTRLSKSKSKNLVGNPASSMETSHSQLNAFHPHPIGYIVRYVPHDQDTLPSPVLGSPHQESSDCTNNNSNTTQHTKRYAQSKNENVNNVGSSRRRNQNKRDNE